MIASSVRSGALVLAVLGVMLLVEGEARGADDISARLVEDFVYDDKTAQVRVEIGEVDEDVVAAELVVPDRFRAEGPFGGVQRTSVVNGVSRSVIEIGFSVVPPAGAKGEYVIGPVRVRKRSGAVVEVPVGTLKVALRPERGVSFEVAADPPGGPVMMPTIVRYRVLYSGQVEEEVDVFGSARTPLGLTALSIPLLDRAGVRVEPERHSGGEPDATVRLGDLAGGIHRGSVEIDDEIWQTLEFALRVTPLRTDDLDLSAEVGMSLTTGVEKRRDIFNRVVEVPVTQVFRARTGPATYRVEELPAKGRPAGFAGAVGTFTIEAESAAREVNAFDPIEVRVTIRGRGVMDRLSLPRWSAMPEITRDFELDADLDPGEVIDDAKVFKVVFRARSSAVEQIPSLPFPYFDPFEGRYEVARSEPVPIKVYDVKTVRPEDAIGGNGSADPTGSRPTEPIGEKLGIGANFETLSGGEGRLRTAPPLFTPAFLAILTIPPLFAVAVLLRRRARVRAESGPRGTPLSRALDGLADAPPDRAAELFATYFREKADLPEGEVTTSEIARALTARSAPEATVDRVTEAHTALISARFAGGVPPSDLADVLREVDRCLG